MLLRAPKRKRVSWARDGNLCQVRLFLSEDSPSQAGKAFQEEHMQPKKKSFNCIGSVNHGFWPPGFQGVSTDVQLSPPTHMKWRCPPRFLLNASWEVVAGEESEEVKIQNERELRMLEEFYPDSSAIPSNPAISPDTIGSIYDDSKTPLVPVIPIEEDEAIGDASTDPSPSNGSWTTSFPPGYSQASYATTTTSVPYLPENGGLMTTPLSSQPQLLAAASAMLNALTSGNDLNEKSMINHDFLAKVFSDPAKLTELVNNQTEEQDGKRTGSRMEMQDAKRVKMDSGGLRGPP